MDCHQTYYLALLQGLTEFLPIPGAAHEILLPTLLGSPSQTLALAVAFQIGTLTAVVIYFSGALRDMGGAWLGSLTGKGMTNDARLAWYLLLGSIPAGLAGLALDQTAQGVLRSPLAITASTIVFGLLLWLAWKLRSERRTETGLKWTDVLIVGLFQAVALIPGVSRSGITMTGGLFLGLERKAPARFSYLLSLPITIVAGAVKAWRLAASHEPIAWWHLFLAALLSGIVAYVAIDWFLKLLDRIGILPFVIYRLLLGGVLLYVFLPQML